MKSKQSLAGYVRVNYQTLHRRIHFEGVKQEAIVEELEKLGIFVSVQVFRNAMTRAKKIIDTQPVKQEPKTELPKKKAFEFRSAAENNLSEEDF